ncbi:unnamed protein product [Clonostachys rosea]|uniref:Uncharacterized protein n=1 Tax=Bionectria ochroleuca TaxID=29856 RepID=A0ABY6UVF0_BIOOC|nr:unnamed protein product [Clonostachys rosea]
MTNLYDASIPVFKSGMISLKNILTKAIDHYGPDSSKILTATLIEDLRPLVGHVHLSSNIAKKSLTRMAGVPTEVWEDNEDTAEKLIERSSLQIKLMDMKTIVWK